VDRNERAVAAGKKGEASRGHVLGNDRRSSVRRVGRPYRSIAHLIYLQGGCMVINTAPLSFPI
jgi:hypothetical protein